MPFILDILPKSDVVQDLSVHATVSSSLDKSSVNKQAHAFFMHTFAEMCARRHARRILNPFFFFSASSNPGYGWSACSLSYCTGKIHIYIFLCFFAYVQYFPSVLGFLYLGHNKIEKAPNRFYTITIYRRWNQN